MEALLQSIVSLLVAGITSFGEGLAAGILGYITALFVTTTEAGVYQLTIFGGLIVIFAGISLCIGITRWVAHWLTSFGKSRSW